MTDELVIDHDYEDERLTRLRRNGAPADAFLRPGCVLDVASNVIDVEYKDQYAKHLYTAASQLAGIDKFLDNITKPNLMVVSSYPNDRMAKQLGLWLMLEAEAEFARLPAAVKRERARDNLTPHPLWKPVYATFKDDMLSGRSISTPGMILFSEVTDMATQHRMGTLRDLLNKTSEVPRVVVTAAADPWEFAKLLRIDIDYGVFMVRQ